MTSPFAAAWLSRLAPVALILGLPALGSTPVSIDPAKELLILDLAVIERSAQAQSGSFAPFTIEHLLCGISRDDSAKTALLDWLHAWRAPTKDGAFVEVGKRLIARWKDDDGICRETPDEEWTPNFANAPFRLLAIVYRPDLQQRDLDGFPLNGREGRFVFGVTLGPGASPSESSKLNATVIFEYELPANDELAVATWAKRWHALGAFADFGVEYCAALADVTTRFTQRGAAPWKTNGSALGRIRTNEVNLSGLKFPGSREDNEWVLGEFRLDPNSGLPAAVYTKQNPPHILATRQELADYVNTHEFEILAERHVVPEKFKSLDFLTRYSVLPKADVTLWNPKKSKRASAISNPEARFNFSIGTCSGCHGVETRTHFTHLSPRLLRRQSVPSDYLGNTSEQPVLMDDPASRNSYPRLPPLAVRKAVLAALVRESIVFDTLVLKPGETPRSVRPSRELVDLLRNLPRRVH